jgi:hypothetical protein
MMEQSQAMALPLPPLRKTSMAKEVSGEFPGSKRCATDHGDAASVPDDHVPNRRLSSGSSLNFGVKGASGDWLLLFD